MRFVSFETISEVNFLLNFGLIMIIIKLVKYFFNKIFFQASKTAQTSESIVSIQINCKWITINLFFIVNSIIPILFFFSQISKSSFYYSWNSLRFKANDFCQFLI